MSVVGEAAASEIQPVSSMEAREGKLATIDKTEDKPDSEIETNDSKTITDEAGQLEQQQEGVTESTSRKKLEPDSEGDITSMASEKALKTSESTVSGALQSGSEGNSPFAREKVMEDGYNWRKYGQKLVKGNEFIRSYYRCTHPNCTAKKQLERSQGGQIVDIVYFGKHDHPRPLGNNSATPAAFPINEHKPNELLAGGGSKAKSSGSVLLTTHHQTEPTETRRALQVSIIPTADDVKTAVLQSSRMKDETDKDETSGSKRRKKEGGNIERSQIERSTSESRVVVHTQTIFDSVNDGYRWRKYGQKSVKGSPHPRSYYRCSSPGCPVKKHVERSSHDAKLLITTYEGKHDHDMPPGRVVTHNTDSGIEKANHKELSPKGGYANKTPQSSAAPEASLREQLDDSSRLNSELANTNRVETKPDPGVVLDSQPNKQSKGVSDQTRDGDEAASHTTSVTDSEDKATIVCHESSVSNLKGQEQKPKAEPVQS